MNGPKCRVAPGGPRLAVYESADLKLLLGGRVAATDAVAE